MRVVKMRHQSDRSPAGAIGHERHARCEQAGIAAHLVDDEARDQPGVIGIDHGSRPAQACDHPAAVDVTDQHHWGIDSAGKSHIGDIIGAQVHFRCGAGALDQHDVTLRADFREAVEHVRHQFGLAGLVFARARVTEHASLHHDLRADLALRFQQYRIHVDRRRHPRGARLQGLGAADLAAFFGHRGVVGHILRLERPNRQTTVGQQPAKTGHDQRLADVGPGPLKHQRAPGHQNSMPAWVFTPAEK